MPKTNLGSMSVEQLLQLRDEVGKELKAGDGMRLNRTTSSPSDC